VPAKAFRIKGVNIDWIVIAAYSKKAYNFLKGISPSFSTSDGVGAPKEILSAPPPVQSAFLRAFWGR